MPGEGEAQVNTMTTENIVRAAAIEMLRSGLATQAEIAVLVRTSRQRIQYWARVENINAVDTRKAWLKKVWREVIRQI
jgi:hypothetical protein